MIRTAWTQRGFIIMVWVALLCFDTATQLLFKLGSGTLEGHDGLAWLWAVLSSHWVLLGALSYFGAFLCWTLVLRETDLSLAFPMSALGTAAVLVASWAILGETIDWQRWGGAVLIMLGFLCMIGETPD